MSFEDRVSFVNKLVQSSFRNAMDSVESIHQTAAEMPLDILTELGYPEDLAEAAKESHRQVLRIVYGGICSANEELGKLVVLQADGLNQFFGNMVAGAGSQKPPARQPARTARKKAAKKKARKAARKVAKKKATKKKVTKKKLTKNKAAKKKGAKKKSAKKKATTKKTRKKIRKKTRKKSTKVAGK